MRRYKLLKDLPGYTAGQVFVARDDGSVGLDDGGGAWVYLNHILTSEGYKNSAFDGWFEPLPEAPTRWRADEHEGFFYIRLATNGVEVDTTSPHKSVSSWEESQYEIGNYFKTKEQAEAVATAIESLLEYVHEPLDENGYNKKGLEMSKKAAIACQAVRAANKEEQHD